MGKKLVEKLLPALGKLRWVGAETPTEQGRRTYWVSLEQIDSFRGDDIPTLVGALRTLQTAVSLPFTYAGVAYALLAASQEDGGGYYQEGLEAAMGWLERAQELAPDEVDINMIEGLIYIYNGRLADARLILDYLHQNTPLQSYYLNMAEVAYWRERGDLEQTLAWLEQTEQTAVNVPQRLRLKFKRAECYIEFGQLEEAIEVYREATHFDNENAWLWHSLSLAYLDNNDYKNAKSCNEKALNLRADFPAAHEVESVLKRKLGSDLLGLGRWFGGKR